MNLSTLSLGRQTTAVSGTGRAVFAAQPRPAATQQPLGIFCAVPKKKTSKTKRIIRRKAYYDRKKTKPWNIAKLISYTEGTAVRSPEEVYDAILGKGNELDDEEEFEEEEEELEEPPPAPSSE